MGSRSARSSAPSLAVVVGMRREARIVAGDGVSAIVGGGRGYAIEHLLERALRNGASGVLSFGVCGGLDPNLAAGDCVIASAVLNNGARFPADTDWICRLAAALPEASLAEFAAEDAAVASRDAKRALRERTGAAAVDMESHFAARLAERWQVPFAAVRTVSDPADHDLPRAAQVGLGPDGEADLRAVFGALASAPWELPALLRTAVETEAAFRSLVRCRGLLGPGLGRPDFGQLMGDVP